MILFINVEYFIFKEKHGLRRNAERIPKISRVKPNFKTVHKAISSFIKRYTEGEKVRSLSNVMSNFIVRVVGLPSDYSLAYCKHQFHSFDKASRSPLSKTF